MYGNIFGTNWICGPFASLFVVLFVREDRQLRVPTGQFAWWLLASLCKVTSFKGDMSRRLVKASPPQMVSLRQLVLPPTKISIYYVAKTMRNVPFLQIYPTRAFANPIIRFCITCWLREKLVVLFLRLRIVSFHKKTNFNQFKHALVDCAKIMLNLCVCRKPTAQ